MANFEFILLPPSVPSDIESRSKFWYEKISTILSLTQYSEHSKENAVNINPITEGVYILDYLANYLAALDAKTLIVEYNYVDKVYLKDFQRYHLSCYQHYKKTCSRLHFFRKLLGDYYNLPEAKFLEFLEIGADDYLGFIVLRPLPRAYIGRTMLLPKETGAACNFLIVPDSKSHLFGKTFKLSSLVFLQQDKSVGACSPTSLWMALNAVKDSWELGDIPSVSELTEMSGIAIENINRTFPNVGLYIPQLEAIIKAFGLEPDYLSPESFNMPNEIVSAYLKAKIPVIMIIRWYRFDDNGDFEFTTSAGAIKKCSQDNQTHTCVISGIKEWRYRETESTSQNLAPGEPQRDQKEINLKSSRLGALYIHDDRRGLFEEADLRKISLKGCNGKPTFLCDELVFRRSNGDEKSGFWSLWGMLLPVYPKIRIPFQHVRLLVANLQSCLYYIRNTAFSVILERFTHLKNKLPKDEFDQLILRLGNYDKIQDDLVEVIADPEKMNDTKDLVKIRQFLDFEVLEWDIFITSSNEYKQRAIQDISSIPMTCPYQEKIQLNPKEFRCKMPTIIKGREECLPYSLHKPSGIDKSILLDALPRFFWLIQCFSRTKKDLVMEFLIDATDIDPPISFYRAWVNDDWKDLMLKVSDWYSTDLFNLRSSCVNEAIWRTEHLENTGTIHQLVITFFAKLADRIKKWA
jgi:hypothetical protein